MVGPVVPPVRARKRTESLEAVDKAQLVTQRDCEFDEGVDEGRITLPTLAGEHPLYHGLTSAGHIVLTTYRLFYNCNETSHIVPRGLIDRAEARETTLVLVCKDGKIEYCSMASMDSCIKWRDRITTELSTSIHLADSFALAYFITSNEVPIERCKPQWLRSKGYRWKLGDEIKRLKIDLKNVWRITTINDDFSVCPSYPRELIVPRQFTDEQLKKSSQFRTKHRFPSLVWRNKQNGAALLRCSQPTTGWSKRCEADEQLVTAVMEACKMSSLKVVDARSWIAAAGNCVWNNGGYESGAYYDRCCVVYQSLPNIHAVRASFLAVRDLSTKDSASWLTSLENTKWLPYLLLMFEAAEVCVASLTNPTSPEPVLVHCSDGWDRTPQVVALTQLILDPFYRTFKGFEHLVKREWIAFGHKFADRCGNSLISPASPDEVCPVFIQWLDGVHQLMLIYPSAFEFNEAYLLKLCQHVYSGLFGNFMHNTLKKRREEPFMEDTASVWGYLQYHELVFTNKLYKANSKQALSRLWHLRDLKLWTNVYLSPRIPNRDFPADTLDASTSSLGRRTLSDSDLSIVSADEHLTSSQTNLNSKLSSSVISILSNVSVGEGGRSRHGSKASLREVPSGASLSHTPPVQIAPQSPPRKSNEDSGCRRGFFLRLGDDGLIKTVLPVDKCLNRFVVSKDLRIKQLEAEVEKLKILLLEEHISFPPHLPTPSDQGAELSGNSSGDGSDKWEVCEDKDGITKWIPDHMVNYCSGCTVPFRIYRRKHHCRNCGQIFCVNCANDFVPIPDQYLFDAARVCKICSAKLSKSREKETKLELQPDSPTTPIAGACNIGVMLASTSEPILIPSPNSKAVYQGASNSPTTSDSGLLFKTCSQDSVNINEAQPLSPQRAKCV